jgi:hypothetical protein
MKEGGGPVTKADLWNAAAYVAVMISCACNLLDDKSGRIWTGASMILGLVVLCRVGWLGFFKNWDQP